jgi:peptidoglycan/xylan/chitin deacetylase (PgdA/CDA1 family)
MTGTLLLTFDCEGKWGVVDRLAPHHRECYTSRALEAAYRGVLSLLERYEIDATFAFTAAFTMNPARFRQLGPELERSGAAATSWMAHAMVEIERENGDGWFAPACFSAVQQAGDHEIASHGFSHIPWRASYVSREVAAAELGLTRMVTGFDSPGIETFVYPRNQLAHQDLLPAYGFRIFRAARPSLGRPANLMRELNVFSPSETLGRLDVWPVEVPAGYYLNWRRGLRRCIPLAVTVRRWKHLLRHAARTGGIVHAWTHPEDFVDGHAMFTLLETILRFTADEREAGRLRVMTCRELVRLGCPSG